jgi:hypothetical protein
MNDINILKNEPATLEQVSRYQISGEQNQYWDYCNNLTPEQLPPVITMDMAFSELDVAALEQAFGHILQRHESLRTFFRETDEGRRQFVMPYSAKLYNPVYCDISNSDQSEDVISEVVKAEQFRLGDIGTPPLFRLCLFKRKDKSYYVTLLIHHIIADNWSLTVLTRELYQYYIQIVFNQPVKWNPLRMQLKDYSIWQQNWLMKNGGGIRSYWNKKLGIYNQVVLPLLKAKLGNVEALADHTALRTRLTALLDGPGGYHVCYSISGDLFEYLSAFIKNRKVTIGTLIITSFKLLFHLKNDRRAALFALPVLSRYVPGTEEIIGCLGGGVYVCDPIDEERTIPELLNDVAIEFLTSAGHMVFDHDEMCLDGNALRLNCDLSINLISKEMNEGQEPEPGLSKDMVHKASGSPYYALACDINQYGSQIVFKLNYQREIYTPAYVEDFIAMHLKILRFMVQNTGARVCHLKNLI